MHKPRIRGPAILACCRYVELNPLRAVMVDEPEAYRWSSCPAKVGRVEKNWLDLDPFYLGLAATPAERAARYREWLRQTIPEGEWKLSREATQRGELTGSGKFVDEISDKLGRRLETCGRTVPERGKNKSVAFFGPLFRVFRRKSW